MAEENTNTTENSESTQATVSAVPSTPQELLDAVNNAIIAVSVGGQSYRIGSRSLTRADLSQLYKMRNDLTAQVAAQNNSPLLDDCYVAIFDGR